MLVLCSQDYWRLHHVSHCQRDCVHPVLVGLHAVARCLCLPHCRGRVYPSHQFPTRFELGVLVGQQTGNERRRKKRFIIIRAQHSFISSELIIIHEFITFNTCHHTILCTLALSSLSRSTKAVSAPPFPRLSGRCPPSIARAVCCRSTSPRTCRTDTA